MSDMLSNARRIVAQFNKRRTIQGGPRFAQMQAGKNVYRLFPFRHVVNAWDVAVGRYPEEDLGKEVDALVAPVIRYYLGSDDRGKGGRMVNGLDHSWRCPLYKAYYSTPRDERNRRERPADLYIVNALDMNRVGDGINPVIFKDSEWLGQKVSDGSRVTYGMLNLILGWPIKGIEDSEDSEDSDDEEGPGSGVLKPFAGYGEKILGPRGQDIVLVKKMGKVGSNDALLLDKAAKGGPVKIRSKKASVEVPEKLLAGITDLFLLPEAFPGWSSDGHHIEHPDTPDMVSQFIVAIKGVPSAGRLAEPVPGGAPPEEADDDDLLEPGAEEARDGNEFTEALEDGDEEIAPEPETAQEPETAKKPRKKLGLAEGERVRAIDKDEENGVEVTFAYIGKVHKVVGGNVEVTLAVEDQDSDRTKALVDEAIKAQKTNVFKFPREAIEKIEG